MFYLTPFFATVPGANGIASVTVRDFFFAAGRNPFVKSNAPNATTAGTTEQFSVAVLTVQLSRKVWLYRPHTGAVEGGSEGLDFERNALYPEEIQDTAFGENVLHPLSRQSHGL
jgi:hypothetical protein